MWEKKGGLKRLRRGNDSDACFEQEDDGKQKRNQILSKEKKRSRGGP